jgi:hypothetical protein
MRSAPVASFDPATDPQAPSDYAIRAIIDGVGQVACEMDWKWGLGAVRRAEGQTRRGDRHRPGALHPLRPKARNAPGRRSTRLRATPGIGRSRPLPGSAYCRPPVRSSPSSAPASPDNRAGRDDPFHSRAMSCSRSLRAARSLFFSMYSHSKGPVGLVCSFLPR